MRQFIVFFIDFWLPPTEYVCSLDNRGGKLLQNGVTAFPAYFALWVSLCVVKEIVIVDQWHLTSKSWIMSCMVLLRIILSLEWKRRGRDQRLEIILFCDHQPEDCLSPFMQQDAFCIMRANCNLVRLPSLQYNRISTLQGHGGNIVSNITLLFRSHSE